MYFVVSLNITSSSLTIYPHFCLKIKTLYPAALVEDLLISITRFACRWLRDVWRQSGGRARSLRQLVDRRHRQTTPCCCRYHVKTDNATRMRYDMHSFITRGIWKNAQRIPEYLTVVTSTWQSNATCIANSNPEHSRFENAKFPRQRKNSGKFPFFSEAVNSAHSNTKALKPSTFIGSNYIDTVSLQNCACYTCTLKSWNFQWC